MTRQAADRSAPVLGLSERGWRRLLDPGTPFLTAGLCGFQIRRRKGYGSLGFAGLVTAQIVLAVALIGNVLALAACTPEPTGGAQATLELRAAVFPTENGEPLPAELGRLQVPERHERPDGPQIEVAVARIRTTSASPGLPILYLEGGPGGAGIHPERAALFRELRKHADVITFDLRGSGASSPALDCPQESVLAPHLEPDRRSLLELHVAAATRCRAQLEAQGIDLAAYNASQAVQDVDAIRRAFGVERMQLVGISFGSHLALATLKRFSERIDRLVLALPEGPDQSVKLPEQLDAHLARMSSLIAADPVAGPYLPDLESTVRRALERLEREPLEVPQEDGSTMRFTPFLFRQLVAGSIVRRQFLRFAPEEYSGLGNDDFSALTPFIESSHRARASGIRLSMDCASGVSAGRWQRVLEERGHTTLAGVTDFPYPEVCDAWSVEDLGQGFRADPESSHPVQFIVGTLDGLTPETNAAELSRGLPHSGTITVELMGHEGPGIWLDAGEVMSLVGAFVAGGPPVTKTVSAPSIDWVLPGQKIPMATE